MYYAVQVDFLQQCLWIVWKIQYITSAKLNDADFDFIAIPIDILQSEADNCDVLVLGPQVAHKLDAVKPIIEPRKIPYVIVDQETYGKMDGATVMKQALIARRKADLKK